MENSLKINKIFSSHETIYFKFPFKLRLYLMSLYRNIILVQSYFFYEVEA